MVAFTTPQLFGARLARPRTGAPPDLILSNLSGQTGNTVLPGAQVLATPGLTAHDQALWQKLRELADLGPARIREAMIDIAARVCPVTESLCLPRGMNKLARAWIAASTASVVME